MSFDLSREMETDGLGVKHQHGRLHNSGVMCAQAEDSQTASWQDS